MAFEMADYLEVEVSAEMKCREAMVEAKQEKNNRRKADKRKKGMVKVTPAQANSWRSNATILLAILMANTNKYHMQASLYEYNIDLPQAVGISQALVDAEDSDFNPAKKGKRITVSSTHTLEELKNKIQEKTKVPVDEQLILLSRRMLRLDNRTLESLRVPPGAHLFVELLASERTDF